MPWWGNEKTHYFSLPSTVTQRETRCRLHFSTDSNLLSLMESVHSPAPTASYFLLHSSHSCMAYSSNFKAALCIFFIQSYSGKCRKWLHDGRDGRLRNSKYSKPVVATLEYKKTLPFTERLIIVFTETEHVFECTILCSSCITMLLFKPSLFHIFPQYTHII